METNTTAPSDQEILNSLLSSPDYNLDCNQFEAGLSSYQLFIGSNNDTGKLEMTKIIQVLKNHFQGFTIVKSKGYWQDSIENSCVVTISTDFPSDIVQAIYELKTVLRQDCIGVVRISDTMKFI